MAEKETKLATTAPQPGTELAKLERNVADIVLSKVNKFIALGELRLPKDYSPENALKSAWLLLQDVKTKDEKPVLVACTKDSIANTLFNMVIQALSPMKKQCDFIAYGNKLTLQREYYGTIALARRFGDVKEVPAQVVYQGDVFEYAVDVKTGRKMLIKHEQGIANIQKDKIIGAYAIVVYNDGSTDLEVMSMAQIQQAWLQGSMKGQSGAHKNFPDRMARKTVINRALTTIIASSSDAALYDEDEGNDKPVEAMRDTVKDNGNGVEFTMETQEAQPEPEPEATTTVNQAKEIPAEVDAAINNNLKVKEQTTLEGPDF